MREFDDAVREMREEALKLAEVAGVIPKDGFESMPEDQVDPVQKAEDWLKKFEGTNTRPTVDEVYQVAIPILLKLNGLRLEEFKKRLSVLTRIRKSAFDEEVRKKKPKEEGSLGGTAMEFEEVLPWESPVDGAALFDEIEETLKRFMIMPDHAAAAIVLWVAFSHSIDFFRVSPILAITSPEMRCGKTTLLSIITQLVPKPLASSNISGPALFRSIEKWSPTLIVDEADSFLRDDEALRGIFNSGHTRTTAYVIRTVGDDHEPRRFRTWGAKAVALIGKLPATMTDRSVVIPLQRKSKERIERLREGHSVLFSILRRKLSRWVQDNSSKLKEANPEVPENLNDRAQDNWRPLLTIADAAGEIWQEKARRTAEKLSGEIGGGGLGVQLLADIREVISGKYEADQFIHSSMANEEKFFSSVLLEEVLKLEERPWAEAYKGKGLTVNRMAHLLEPYGIRSQQIRIGSASKKGYLRESFEDAFSRYLPVLAPQRETQKQNNNNDGLSKLQNETRKTDVSFQKARIHNNDAGCFDVSLQKGVDRELSPMESKNDPSGGGTFQQIEEADLL